MNDGYNAKGFLARLNDPILDTILYHVKENAHIEPGFGVSADLGYKVYDALGGITTASMDLDDVEEIEGETFREINIWENFQELSNIYLDLISSSWKNYPQNNKDKLIADLWEARRKVSASIESIVSEDSGFQVSEDAVARMYDSIEELQELSYNTGTFGELEKVLKMPMTKQVFDYY